MQERGGVWLYPWPRTSTAWFIDIFQTTELELHEYSIQVNKFMVILVPGNIVR